MLIKTLYILSVLSSFSISTRPPCDSTERRCRNGRCISMEKYCNGFSDCSDQSDEPPNCSPCNVTYVGQTGRTYELEIKKPKEHELPFLCYLNFTAGGGSLGELIQLNFESFAVGTFESFTTDGCPDGFISIKEGNRPNAGGKWCGSAWGYTVYYSETSSVNVTLQLDRLPQQSSGYSFEFKLSYKYLKLSDARIRYGNATQKSYRGKLHVGTYCDRLLEGCARRPCRIQSPNYPGIYPRNISCHYRVRERNVPAGKHALIAVRQANFHHRDQVPKYENGERVFRIWDQCNMMQDYIEILDGWNNNAPILAHLCSGEIIPEIISSGPELLVKFHTSPFGNPFHPLPLSYLPGFELEVQVYYVDKESPSYVEHGKKCEFILTTFDNSSGLLESPLHSLPPNTTCHYHFRGQNHEVVWISFIKYHVASERVGEYDSVHDCDVELQLFDGDVKNGASVPLIGQFCKDDKPKLCDHTLLKNSSRLTRPCALSESYVSTGPDLTIAHSVRYGNVLYPASFILRYEFVDLSQEGVQVSLNPCDRIFKSTNGKFYSPKITFLYGRGGQRDLNCAYHFESTEYQRLKLTFTRAGFGQKSCSSRLDHETDRWSCASGVSTARLTISEYPWPGIEATKNCLCSNITNPITITTKTARKVVVNFLVTDMKITEDYKDYFFEATFEFISPSADSTCVNPWKNHRLRGTSGEISLRNNVQTLKQSEQSYYFFNQSTMVCAHQPWLIEPEDSFTNFIYLKIQGMELKNSSDCPTKNRILVYPADSEEEELHVICPLDYDNSDGILEMFSDGWNMFSYRRMKSKNSRSFVIEFVQVELGNFVVTWMEVSKNPKLMLPASMLMISPPDCPHSCPELGACISSELWCDGLRHCPSGSDEQEINCAIRGGFPVTLVTSAVFVVIVLIIITLASGVSVYAWKHWRRERKNVIVSVTEHTFLEFKSGLC